MSAPEMPRDPRVSRAFRDLEKEHAGPEGDWQARVWSRIAREPQDRWVRRRLRIFQLTSVTLAVAMVVMGAWAWRTSEIAEQKEAKAKAALASYEEQVDRAQREIDEAIAAKEKAYQALLASKNEADKLAAKRALELSEKELEAKRYLLKELREREAKKSAIRREKAKRVNVKCDPSDPLCGL